ncbi:uncharacterized protein LOC126922618 [Bombus affinis]|uniref:uncharacterized protein LOC126922618 n=1 Tax=Bombus affinis TaxID=309941 RepID=UPI0021B80463|nr:uncharacterized protein LOC126922618 [Bombus affinis]
MLCLSSRILSKRSSSAVIQFIDSEESRKQLNQEESEIIPARKIKTETEKPNLQIETLLEIFRKQNMHEREGTDFAIKQFDRTQKATDWILEYETECEKYEIQNDEKRIKNLKKYLGKTASEWYQTNLLKDEEYNWENWKAAFLKTFSNKGWSAVRYAYNFKYISGSFTEYAIKKERLILEGIKEEDLRRDKDKSNCYWITHTHSR